MAWHQPDNDLLSILQQISTIYSQFNLPNSQNILNDIKNELQNGVTAGRIDKNSINLKYRTLQTTYAQEFSRSDSHRSGVISMLQASMNRALTQNNVETQHVMNEPNVVEIIQRRSRAYGVLRTFRQIIWNGAQTDEEKIIGLSYVYLNLVDGVFRNALRACYIWQQLSRNDPVDTTTLLDTSVNNIRQYFTNTGLPMHYFEGWQGYVRNAVGHTTFHYDTTRNLAVYDDFIAGITTTLSLQQLIDMCDKLWNVYEASFLSIQFTRINDVCSTLCDRYP